MAGGGSGWLGVAGRAESERAESERAVVKFRKTVYGKFFRKPFS